MDLNKIPCLEKSITFKEKSVNNDKFLVFDTSTAIAFLTNKVGIWTISKCNGKKTILGIIHDAQKVFNQSEKIINKDIKHYLTELKKNKIIILK